jgi:hypothetical protein
VVPPATSRSADAFTRRAASGAAASEPRGITPGKRSETSVLASVATRNATVSRATPPAPLAAPAASRPAAEAARTLTAQASAPSAGTRCDRILVPASFVTIERIRRFWTAADARPCRNPARPRWLRFKARRNPLA